MKPLLEELGDKVLIERLDLLGAGGHQLSITDRGEIRQRGGQWDLESTSMGRGRAGWLRLDRGRRRMGRWTVGEVLKYQVGWNRVLFDQSVDRVQLTSDPIHLLPREGRLDRSRRGR